MVNVEEEGRELDGVIRMRRLSKTQPGKTKSLGEMKTQESHPTPAQVSYPYTNMSPLGSGRPNEAHRSLRASGDASRSCLERFSMSDQVMLELVKISLTIFGWHSAWRVMFIVQILIIFIICFDS